MRCSRPGEHIGAQFMKGYIRALRNSVGVLGRNLFPTQHRRMLAANKLSELTRTPGCLNHTLHVSRFIHCRQCWNVQHSMSS